MLVGIGKCFRLWVLRMVVFSGSLDEYFKNMVSCINGLLF